MELDKIITGDSAVVLQSFPPDCIDLSVQSPPYDGARKYNGYSFDFETIASQLYRVTKTGGVVVWVVGDQTKNGSESGTSFRQALYFMQCGFNLHDTMIYLKSNPVPMTHNRYEQQFEYMFVFSKGKPKTFNPLMQPCKTAGKKYNIKRNRPYDGNAQRHFRNEEITTASEKFRYNVWEYSVGTDKNKSNLHPAVFPELLAQDHIISWSNEGDTVLDCFCGSGTTPKMAKLLNRHYIGIEVSAEYVALANGRLAQVERGLTLPAPDGGDSSAQQALSTPDMFSAIEHEPTPAPRR